jgi:hypothetical protein
MSEKLAGGPEVRYFDVRSAGDGGNASEIGELWPSPVEKVGILRAKDRQNVCVRIIDFLEGSSKGRQNAFGVLCTNFWGTTTARKGSAVWRSTVSVRTANPYVFGRTLDAISG